MDDKRVSIYLPQNLLKTKSGWLLGYWIANPRPIAYILAVIHGSDPFNTNLAINHAKICKHTNEIGNIDFVPSVIGELRNKDLERRNNQTTNASVMLRQVSDFYIRLQVCNYGLHVNGVNVQGKTLNSNLLLYLYKPDDILSSKLLNLNTEIFRKQSDYYAEFDGSNCVEKLLIVFHLWQNLKIRTLPEMSDVVGGSVNSSINLCTDKEDNRKSRYYRIQQNLLKPLSCSSFLKQCSQRFHQVHYLMAPSPLKLHLSSCLRCHNTITSIVLDILLGLFILHRFLEWTTVEDFFELFINSTDLVVDRLQTLIRWLMGNPAGLKLNFQLSSALGNFFLYHIYLWKTYISIVQPLIHYIMETITVIGWFGFTFQLSVLSDLVSLATFHIYCFYVYATRLYHLHVCGLISLWRLVRGRKWNPLRQRVDSCEYNVDRLFLGTLLFMILLFLFPTTVLFYAVFCCLRLAVVAVIGTLNHIIVLMSTLPSYAMLLHLGNSRLVAGDVRFTIVPSSKLEQPVILKLEVVPSSVKKVWSAAIPRNYTDQQWMLWTTFLKDLLIGNLVYPI